MNEELEKCSHIRCITNIMQPNLYQFQYKKQTKTKCLNEC